MTKTWFVTGSSRGLGRAIVQAALDAGDNVVATARNTDSIKDLVAAGGSRIKAMALDVSDAEAIKRVIPAAKEAFGRLDVIVNNAGKADLVAIEDSSDEMFRDQVETCFMGIVNVTKAALPILRAQGSGHFIQLSSAGARMAVPGLAAYQASKWAVTGFSQILANEIAPLGLKVTIIEPGTMRTDMPGGSSMEVPPISDPYKASVGMIAEMLTTSHAQAPVDPEKVAKLILDLVDMDEPPVRLLVGSDAVMYGEQITADLQATDKKWEELSRSVDFAAA